jgi:hypothetical protein
VSEEVLKIKKPATCGQVYSAQLRASYFANIIKNNYPKTYSQNGKNAKN